MDLTKTIKQIIKDFSTQELTEIAIALTEHLETVSGVDIAVDEFADKRFADGLS